MECSLNGDSTDSFFVCFDKVRKAFGKKVVLDDLSLKVPKGEVSFLIGKSGEGKSVTIKHIMGLMFCDRGRVIVDGQTISDLEEDQLLEHRRKIGMLFQHAALFDSMTVGENVKFPLQEQTKQSKADLLERVEQVLNQVGLPGIQHKMPAELSTGEKKRIGLARALVTKPSLILYDEPTTGMDPFVSQMIDDLIVKVNEEEKEMTSIVISHDLKAALDTAQNIFMLYGGQVAAEGSPKDFREMDHPVVRQFFSGSIEGPMKFI